MELTDRATERQVRDYDQAGVITAAKIVRSEHGYIVVIRLSWKPGDIVVYSQRNSPRAWRSLDRLVAYLGQIAPSIQALDLGLVLTAPPEVAALGKPTKSAGTGRGKKAATKRASPGLAKRTKSSGRKRPSER